MINLILDWRRQWHPTPVLLPGKSYGRRSLVGCSPWRVTKSRTRLSNFTFTFHFHALEKEMATHCSVLAWRIPGTGEPAGLPSMGLHRVGQDWSDLATAAAILDRYDCTFLAPKAKTGVHFNHLTNMYYGGKWEGSSRGRGHMYTYGWLMLMFGRNQHNTVKQLPFN